MRLREPRTTRTTRRKQGHEDRGPRDPGAQGEHDGFHVGFMGLDFGLD